MAVNTLTKASMADNVVQSDANAIEYKPQPPSESVGKPLFNMRSEIENLLADLGVVTKTNVEVLVEGCLIKRPNTLRLQIVKAVEFTFQDTSQAKYFNLINDFKYVVCNFVEQALVEVVRSDRAPAVSEPECAASFRQEL